MKAITATSMFKRSELDALIADLDPETAFALRTRVGRLAIAARAIFEAKSPEAALAVLSERKGEILHASSDLFTTWARIFPQTSPIVEAEAEAEAELGMPAGGAMLRGDRIWRRFWMANPQLQLEDEVDPDAGLRLSQIAANIQVLLLAGLFGRHSEGIDVPPGILEAIDAETDRLAMERLTVMRATIERVCEHHRPNATPEERMTLRVPFDGPEITREHVESAMASA